MALLLEGMILLNGTAGWSAVCERKMKEALDEGCVWRGWGGGECEWGMGKGGVAFGYKYPRGIFFSFMNAI